MYFPAGNILTDAFCQKHAETVLHLHNRLCLIIIQCHNGASAPVDCHKSLLAQNRISLVYGVHIDADVIGKLTDGRKGISLLQHGCRNPEYYLIAQLHVYRLIALEIYLYQHSCTSLVIVMI